MSPDVRVQAALDSKGFRAEGAAEWPHTCVFAHMNQEAPLFDKRSVTLRTAERFFTCVQPHVGKECPTLGECFRTLRAAEQPLSCVDPHVYLKILFGHISLFTNGALVLLPHPFGS